MPNHDNRFAGWRSAVSLLTGLVSCAFCVGAVLYFTSTVDQEAETLGIKRERDTRLMLVDEMQERWVCRSDGLVVGSSRARTLGHPVIDGLRFYSITANGMSVREYAGYVDGWVKRCGKQPTVILIGLDFFGSSVDPMFPAPAPEEYFARLHGVSQRLGIFELLSTNRLLEGLDILLDDARRPLLVEALRDDLPPVLASIALENGTEEDQRGDGTGIDEFAPDASNDAFEEETVTDEEEGAVVEYWFERYRDVERRDLPRRRLDGACAIPRIERAIGSRVALARTPGRFSHSKIYEERYAHYRLDPQFVNQLAELRRRYRDTRIVGVVTPTSHVLFARLVDLGRLPQYEAFLEASIQGLGEIWEFGGLNSVTAARSNFSDENHLHPRAADVMAAIALGMAPEVASLAPPDFGVRLDESNLMAYVDGLRERVQRPRVSPSPRLSRTTSSIPYEVISARRTAKHERRGDCGAPIARRGIEVDVSGVSKTRTLELGLNAAVDYRIEYLNAKGRVVGKTNVAAEPSFGVGARTVTTKIPKHVRGKTLSKLRVVATRGPRGARFLGHLRFR